MRWIKLHDKITTWGWYKDGNTMRVFLHLLLTANFEPSEYQGQHIERGQVVFGRMQLSKELSISEQCVRTAIFHLQSTNEITITATKRFSVATLVNYSKYQGGKDASNQRSNQGSVSKSTNNQPTGNQQVTTSKNIRTIERKREDKNDSTDVESIPPIKPPKKEKPKPLTAEERKTRISVHTNNPALVEAINGWLEIRDIKGWPTTGKSLRLALKRAVTFGKDEVGQIRIFEEATIRSWRGIFPLDGNNDRNNDKDFADRNFKNQNTYSREQLEALKTDIFEVKEF